LIWKVIMMMTEAYAEMEKNGPKVTPRRR
jgi:hypothetical protein